MIALPSFLVSFRRVTGVARVFDLLRVNAGRFQTARRVRRRRRGMEADKYIRCGSTSRQCIPGMRRVHRIKQLL